MEDFSEKSIEEYLSLYKSSIKRYWKYLVWPSMAVLLCGIITAISIPDYYSSDTLIYLDPQRMSTGLVKKPDQNELSLEMEALIQNVLARPKLRKILDEYDLYPEKRDSNKGDEDALRAFSKAISVRQAISKTGGPRIGSYRIEFTNESPDKVFRVTKEIANLFKEVSYLDLRTEARGEKEFIDGQLQQSKIELEQIEEKLAYFAKKYKTKSPEDIRLARNDLNRLEEKIARNEELILFQKGQAQITGSIGGGSELSPALKLVNLKSELESARVRYTDRHPQVIKLKSMIKNLEKALEAGEGSEDEDEDSSTKNIATELSDLSLTRLEKENKRLQQQADKIRKNLETIPEQDKEYQAIIRDYKASKKAYEELFEKSKQAEIASDLVSSQRTPIIKIVEPPIQPKNPAGPPRKIIIIGSIAAGLGSFFFFPLAFLFGSSFKSSAEIESYLGVKVLGHIPPMPTTEIVLNSRKWAFVSALCSLVIVGIVFILYRLFI